MRHPHPEDAGTAAEAERRCLVTRRHGARARMLRFVVGPDRSLVPDLAAALPGRGLWLWPSRDGIITAASRGLFARATGQPVALPCVNDAPLGPEGLADLVERLLVRRWIEGVGLARRAGQAVAGIEKVGAAVASGRGVGLLITASDAAPNAVSKAESLRHRLDPAAEWMRCMSAAELGAGFGRERCVHAAVRAGRLAERLAADGWRLSGLRERRDGD